MWLGKLYNWGLLLSLAVTISCAKRSCSREDKFCSEASDTMGVQEFTQSKIKEGPVVVFSKSYCPYCKATKDLFKGLGVDIVLVELDERDDGGEIQNCLQSITGGRSVPRVFVGGKFVGGNDGTQAAHKDGKLVPMIKEAGGL
ncbi:uncharacterized protein LOC135811639 [Sycon ciliatum]|uniref:uncharacterized protein LOC135811639 n=1 Tax=Sycon ciliatum TaxID=27933 RepID=UPI0031F6246D